MKNNQYTNDSINDVMMYKIIWTVNKIPIALLPLLATCCSELNNDVIAKLNK